MTLPGATSFGEQIAILDIDGDGIAELFVSAVENSTSQIDSVFAYHFSGSGLVQAGQFMSSDHDNSFGNAGLFPISAGSAVELAVADESKPVALIDASLQVTTLTSVADGTSGDDFGKSLGGGDLQGNGLTWLAVGAPEAADRNGVVFVCPRSTADMSFTCTPLADPHPTSDDAFGQAISP